MYTKINPSLTFHLQNKKPNGEGEWLHRVSAQLLGSAYGKD